ncbi:YSC84-related protein [Psychroserpens jangbogonensis]|uniref:YSC84-related protein n=1 Tax=Psychroserpens jangbogonensis TaxID=1484460 RepID=UPI0009E0AAD5|nr:YSC84-related protein [Psychroserpens jangbogonensis]
MKTVQLTQGKIITAVLALIISITMNAQVGGWNPELTNDSNEALKTMLEKTPKLESFYNKSYGYVVFPKITKAGIGIGGAMGKGILFEMHQVVGVSKLKQASFGLQFGGQQYSEVIFFENKDSFEKFTNGKLKFDAQASAVALKKGASIDMAYQNGVAVFTMTKGGLMYEASIGGQHFKYIPKGVVNEQLIKDSKKTIGQVIENNQELKSLKNSAYAYAVFPKIKKVGSSIIVLGEGVVFKNGQAIGYSKLKQNSKMTKTMNRRFSEIIFFENKDAFEGFKNSNIKKDTSKGVAVFKVAKGGSIKKASTNGQYFKYTEAKHL